MPFYHFVTDNSTTLCSFIKFNRICNNNNSLCPVYVRSATNEGTIGSEGTSSPEVGGVFIDDQNSVVTNYICRVLRQELNYQFLLPDNSYILIPHSAQLILLSLIWRHEQSPQL